MVTAVMKLKDTNSFGRKIMTNLDVILKSRSLLTKIHAVKAMFFAVAMYGYVSLTIKKVEWQRIDDF